MTDPVWTPGTGWNMPADAPAVPYAQWEQQCWNRMAESALAALRAGPGADSLSTRAVSTARDGYGWRGIRGRSHIRLDQERQP